MIVAAKHQDIPTLYTVLAMSPPPPPPPPKYEPLKSLLKYEPLQVSNLCIILAMFFEALERL